MTASVAERGYRATSVADVIKRSGTARSTFYTRFTDKEQCFLAAHAAILAVMVERMSRPERLTGTTDERAQTLVRLLFETVAAEPDAARVALIESRSAGDAARAQHREALRSLHALTLHAFGVARKPSPTARMVAAGVCGSLEILLIDHIRDDRLAELPAISEDVARWVASFAPLMGANAPPPPEAPVRRPSRRRGQAPGTLVPVAPSGRRGLPPGPKREPRDFVAHNVRDRLLDAVAAVTARDGYDALTVASVVAEAATSRRSFYEHFSSIPEAFRAAIALGAEGAIAATLLAFGSRSDWREGFVAGLQAFTEFLAEEPTYSAVALVEVVSAGGDAIAERDRAIGTFVAMMAAAFRIAPLRDGIGAELEAQLAVGLVLALCADEIAAGRGMKLPEMAPAIARLALTPPVGDADALAAVTAVSNDD